MGSPAGPPTDDPPGAGVDDEGDIDEAGPGRDIGEIREPQTVWSGSAELSVHAIQRTESRLVADRCPQRLAPDRPPKAHIPHQPGDRAASDAEAFPPQLTPDLAHAIDAEFSSNTRRISTFRSASRRTLSGRREGSARLARWA